MIGQVRQVRQANSYCTHGNLFSLWKRENKSRNRETPAPRVAPALNPYCERETGVVAESLDAEPVAVPSGSHPDWVPIPLSACLVDPLHTGRLIGKVPSGWTRVGWLLSLRDRLSRVDERDNDRVVSGRLEAELRAIERCVSQKPS